MRTDCWHHGTELVVVGGASRDVPIPASAHDGEGDAHVTVVGRIAAIARDDRWTWVVWLAVDGKAILGGRLVLLHVLGEGGEDGDGGGAVNLSCC